MEEEKTSRIRLGVLLLICTVSLLGTISLGIVKGTFLISLFCSNKRKKQSTVNSLQMKSVKIFEKIIWKKVNM